MSDNINVLLRDYYGYEAYFDFDNLNQIINNLYLRIYFDKSYEDIHLNLKKDFSNDNFLFKKDTKKGYKDSNYVIPVFELNEDELKMLNKLNCDEDVCSLEIEDGDHFIVYTYIKYNHILNISDRQSLNLTEWNYFMKEKLITYNYYENGKKIENITIDLDKIDMNDKNYNYIEQMKNNYIIKHLY